MISFVIGNDDSKCQFCASSTRPLWLLPVSFLLLCFVIMIDRPMNFQVNIMTPNASQIPPTFI